MAKVPPLSDDKVVQQLRWLYENGKTVKCQHFRDELQAAGASTLDIECIIADTPKVVSAEWHPKSHDYRYRISGPDLDGETLEFVVVLDTKRSRLIFITAF